MASHSFQRGIIAITVTMLVLGIGGRDASAAVRTFPTGSVVIPMDLSYQDTGVLQAYGLLYQLLRQGVRVYWVIDPGKTYHSAPCNTPGDLCAWDCEIQGSGVKCAYPTSSPDFTAATMVVWHDRGTMAPGSAISSHAYRGGPFVVDAADRDRALAIAAAWNDPSQWAANPWAIRTTFEIVTVHEATAPFAGNVMREMLVAPTIAVFADGNEAIATGYLRAAGIPQSSGAEFPTGSCDAGGCGPGTANPDLLTERAIMGELGTCGAPNADHKNGALFRTDGLPAYCQIMSMHWNVSDRETVQCGGGNCPATQNECAATTPFTYNGHEVVAEVRAFLQYPVHLFAECQAVNAYENTSPNPAWPFLDDAGRDGHFLTTTGTPPACPCSDPDFTCVAGGCNGADCCLSRDLRERGAGFLIAPRPDAATLQVLRPDVPYNQLDGGFGTVGGSEPAYNLSSYLDTQYKNNRQVTLITGPNGPGRDDVWMSGYLDGACDIGPIFKAGQRAEQCSGGKISYLGGHQFSTATPLATASTAMGTRMFLNALFEADCVTSEGQPSIALTLTPLVIAAQTLPIDAELTASFANLTAGPATDATLAVTVPAGATLLSAGATGVISAPTASWDVGSIGGSPAHAGDPANAGSQAAVVQFAAAGDYQLTVSLTYRVGSTTLTTTQPVTVSVKLDGDGDGVPDEDDSAPTDPTQCSDTDADGCDDCASGHFDPLDDGCDDGNPATGDSSGCCSAATDPLGGWSLAGLTFALLVWPRRKRSARTC